MQQRMLIIGAPGAGKTTLLLQLAIKLLEKESSQIPIIINIPNPAIPTSTKNILKKSKSDSVCPSPVVFIVVPGNCDGMIIICFNVGLCVGFNVGFGVGLNVGVNVGAVVGGSDTGVGSCVGEGVGAHVNPENVFPF